MSTKRRLAAMIWIAIVTIAVQLLPASALAHAGHTHVRGSMIAVPQAKGDTLLLNTENTGAVAQANAADVIRAATFGTCNDGCCPSGFSCCGPAILPESILRLPAYLKELKIERPGTSIRAGIDPEALPKPPKSFT